MVVITREDNREANLTMVHHSYGYTIISKKKHKKDQYLYTVSHTKINRNWLILSSSSREDFVRELSEGSFTSGEYSCADYNYTLNMFEQMSFLMRYTN